MMFGHLSCGGGKGKQVIYRRGHLERPLVAVPHRAIDPFRVAGAPADDTADFLAKGADHRTLRQRMVIVIDRNIAARQMRHRRRQPAGELVVIIAVEDVVFAIVLIVQHSIRGGETCLQRAARLDALGILAVSMTGPDKECLGEIGPVLPQLLVDQRLQAGAIGARLRAEDSQSCLLYTSPSPRDE